jgi:hypothetical protein
MPTSTAEVAVGLAGGGRLFRGERLDHHPVAGDEDVEQPHLHRIPVLSLIFNLRALVVR